jgi:hypothetical protein
MRKVQIEVGVPGNEKKGRIQKMLWK